MEGVFGRGGTELAMDCEGMKDDRERDFRTLSHSRSVCCGYRGLLRRPFRWESSLVAANLLKGKTGLDLRKGRIQNGS